ncbi:MAG: 7-carboxy-7-deazaguanine synthase QueE [Bryobacteraceae bacterium]
MKIAEIFYSIQGEGMLAGTPSAFLRVSGCNLRCSWCDTPYASWEPEGEEIALEEVLARVARYRTHYTVVTGGEPLIAPEIVPLTEALRQMGQHVTIETAGTVFAPVDCHLMSISPKMSNSTPFERDGGRWAAPHDRLRIQPGVLRRLMAAYDYQLKFVVQKEEDLAEIKDLVKELHANRQRVVLMPEGTEAEVLRERAVWLVEICKQEGFRFSPRLHIDLYGNRRGV